MASVELYYRDGCPACAEAKEFLSQHRIQYAAHDVVRDPLNAHRTMSLVGPCRKFFVKAGDEMFLWDRDQEEVPNEALRRHFVHTDGFIRIPVLIVGDTAVRGFLPEIYSELLTTPG